MGAIHEQIPKIMTDIGAIGKGKKNTAQGYSFRGIDDVYLAVHSVLAKHGVFTVPEVMHMEREERKTKSGGVLIYTILTVKYTFYASDGTSFESVMVGEAMDSGDKSCNKAMSAAQKYAFLQIFAIPTEEPKDTENDSPQPQPKAEPKKDKTFKESVTFDMVKELLEGADCTDTLKAAWSGNANNIKSLTKENQTKLQMAKDKRKTELKKEGK